MASTGRRALLRAIGLLPLAALPRRSEGADYVSAAEVFDAVDRAEAAVDVRLEAIAALLAPARRFASSVRGAHAGFRAQRARLRRRLGLPAAAVPSPKPDAPRELGALRRELEALAYAYAEGMPALGDALAIDAMARQMVAASSHLTVVDLWTEGENG